MIVVLLPLFYGVVVRCIGISLHSSPVRRRPPRRRKTIILQFDSRQQAAGTSDVLLFFLSI